MQEKIMLTDPLVEPDESVLEATLGKKYRIYQEYIQKITDMNLIPEWRFYNDGKCWLGKVLNKKKNLVWVSIWNTGFKLTFYFSEKIIDDVYSLDISDDIKKAAREMKPVGTSHPVVLLITNKKILGDALKLFTFKMSLK